MILILVIKLPIEKKIRNEQCYLVKNKKKKHSQKINANASLSLKIYLRPNFWNTFWV